MMNTFTENLTLNQPWLFSATPWSGDSRLSDLETLAQGFESIPLKEMDTVALLNRTDTKFVLSTTQLLEVLAALPGDYRMLSVGGRRLSRYRTLYFDTPEFELFHMHVNGRSDRFKVRSREYADSYQSFLEVKHRTQKARTLKARLPISEPVTEITVEAENWLHGVYPFDSRALEPKLWNSFTRLTLVSLQPRQRVTLDVDLVFHAAGQTVHLDGIAIAEVKMDACDPNSRFMTLMRAIRVRPHGFSKYCLGVSMLYDQVKKNAMKPKLLWVEKLTRGVVSQ